MSVPANESAAEPAGNLVELLASTSASNSSLLESPQSRSYLSHLTSLSLPQLVNEPTQLASESSFLATEITNLCHAQYPTFLSLHTASVALSTSFASFATSLTSLIDTAIPNLEEECRSFATSTKEIQSERGKVTTVLEQHDKLLDILEIPQLIDTCVRNGYYQEALDLHVHTVALVARFPTVPVVRSVEVEVNASINQMHSQLLRLLQDPAKLPVLFKSVNFLRRMGVLTEEELALAFLTSRGAYMNGLFEAIERERTMDVTRFLRKWIDLWREGVYDVVTQFSAIFLEDRSSSGTATTQTAVTSPTPAASDTRPYLVSFAHTLIENLLNTLKKTLPQITDAAALSSILTQLSYCSSSFSRIGMDFRSLFPPIFERVVLENITKAFEEAAGTLGNKISEKRKGKKKPSSWLIAGEAISDPPTVPLTLSAGSLHIPSSILTRYPPLAVHLNAYLTALNSLRLLAPTSLVTQLLSALDASLQSTSTALLKYAGTCVQSPRSSFDLGDGEDMEKERTVLVAVSKAWVYLALFVRRALVEGVYEKSLGEFGALSLVEEWEEWARSIGKNDVFEELRLARGHNTEVVNGGGRVQNRGGNRENQNIL